MPLVVTGLVVGGAVSASASPPGVSPSSVSASLDPGASDGPITKTVTTPVIPPRPDVIFLADTTGSMGPTLANVQSNATTIMNDVRAQQSDSQFGAANYTDFNCTDPFPFHLDQAITPTINDVQTAINTWASGNGCDVPEAQLNALDVLATDPSVGFRTGSTPIIVWFGDSSGHDPSNGVTQSQAITDLQAAGIKVIAVPVDSGFGDGLDSTGQATAITSATNGQLLPSATPDQVSNAILSGLTNLPVTVSFSVTCDAGLSAALTPSSQTVTSGDAPTFQETISVDPGATQGATLTCTVRFLLDGNDAGSDFTESISIHVNDVTPPSAACVQTTNPSGKNVPVAGPGAGNSGQNPDGFYQMVFSDNIAVAGAVLEDSASSFSVAVANGEKDKLVQARGATPNWKPGAGVITKDVTTKGDAFLQVTDTSGNVSIAWCRVPPPPK